MALLLRLYLHVRRPCRHGRQPVFAELFPFLGNHELMGALSGQPTKATASRCVKPSSTSLFNLFGGGFIFIGLAVLWPFTAFNATALLRPLPRGADAMECLGSAWRFCALVF